MIVEIKKVTTSYLDVFTGGQGGGGGGCTPLWWLKYTPLMDGLNTPLLFCPWTLFSK